MSAKRKKKKSNTTSIGRPSLKTLLDEHVRLYVSDYLWCKRTGFNADRPKGYDAKQLAMKISRAFKRQ